MYYAIIYGFVSVAYGELAISKARMHQEGLLVTAQ